MWPPHDAAFHLHCWVCCSDPPSRVQHIIHLQEEKFIHLREKAQGSGAELKYMAQVQMTMRGDHHNVIRGENIMSKRSSIEINIVYYQLVSNKNKYSVYPHQLCVTLYRCFIKMINILWHHHVIHLSVISMNILHNNFTLGSLWCTLCCLLLNYISFVMQHMHKQVGLNEVYNFSHHLGNLLIGHLGIRLGQTSQWRTFVEQWQRLVIQKHANMVLYAASITTWLLICNK